jgi:predicted Zn-dependent protease
MRTTTAIAPPPIEQQVARLRAMQNAGRHEEAFSGAEALLTDLPENRDLLLIAASSLRRLSRVPEALAMLDRLEPLQPRFSQLHQERGLCYVALKDAPQAIESLLRAVNINPALPMSWRMLEGVYRLSGDFESAATASAHSATLKALPPEVVAATSLFSDGELELAIGGLGVELALKYRSGVGVALLLDIELR